MLGIERAVIVQASCHGTDNRAMLDAIKTSGGRYRGVAILDASFTEKTTPLCTKVESEASASTSSSISAAGRTWTCSTMSFNA